MSTRAPRRDGAAVAVAACGAAALVALAIVVQRSPHATTDDAAARSRDYEARGRALLVEGQRDPALVYLAEAYALGDRPSLRLLLARALAEPPVDITPANAADFALSPDGALVAIANPDGIALWSATTGTQIRTLPAQAAITAFAWNPDPAAAELVVAAADGARYWDVRTGRASMLDDVPGRVSRIVWGTRVRALVEDARGVALIDLASPRATLRLARMPIAIDPAGERALVCAETCELVGATARVPIAVAALHAAFSPDGTRLAVAARGQLHLFDAAGTERARLAGMFGAPVWSPDGRTIAASDPAGGARVVDAATGTPRATLAGVTSTILSLAFTADGAWLIATTADRAARIWDAATGATVETLATDTALVDVQIARDGSRLAMSVHGASHVRMWSLAERRTPAEVRALVRCRVPLALVDGRLRPAPVACAD